VYIAISWKAYAWMKNIHIAKNPLSESTHDILPGGANKTLVLMMRENESASG